MIDGLIQFWIGFLEIMALFSVLTFGLLAFYLFADLREAVRTRETDGERRHDDAV